MTQYHPKQGQQHPYHAIPHGFGNMSHATMLYATEAGMRHYYEQINSGHLSADEELWYETLFTEMPQRRGHYVDKTNAHYWDRKSGYDHHEAEYFAAIMYDRGYITTDVKKSARRDYSN